MAAKVEQVQHRAEGREHVGDHGQRMEDQQRFAILSRWSCIITVHDVHF